MKKLIGLFVAAMMLFSVMTANAKVTYEEKDGKWTCIITYKNDNMAAVNCIGTMTGNWKVPGEPMVKNAQGEWEYRFVMERAKEFYKFYDPALEGDIAYFEDPGRSVPLRQGGYGGGGRSRSCGESAPDSEGAPR